MISVMQEIRENISLIEALEEYTGVKLSPSEMQPGYFNIPCPFHKGQDNDEVLTVFTDTNSWYCWNPHCGYGDVLRLVSKSLDIPADQVISLLAADLGIDISNIEWDHGDYYSLDESESTCNILVSYLRNLQKQIINLHPSDHPLSERHYVSAKLQYLLFDLLSENQIDKVTAMLKIKELHDDITVSLRY